MDIEIATSPLDRERLIDGLRRHNRANAPDPGWQPFMLVLRSEDGAVTGGFIGESGWEWFHIQFLWIADHMRKQGWGRALLQRAEQEARARGCRGIHLDTHSFQAPDFYQALGYRTFGRLDDYPAGHRRYFMWKSLAGVTPEG
ncbi:MAG: GNAT family N-acetyltransferase [Gemmatimonadales bacterium]